MDDENDIARSRHNLTGKLNDVLSTFRELYLFIKVRLLKITVWVYMAVSYGTSGTPQ